MTQLLKRSQLSSPTNPSAQACHALCLALVASAKKHKRPTWIVERHQAGLWTTRETRPEPRVVIGKNGVVSVVWVVNTLDAIAHRVWDGTKWGKETVAEGLVNNVFIAYDDDGTLHALYDEGGNTGSKRLHYGGKGKLLYAVRLCRQNFSHRFNGRTAPSGAKRFSLGSCDTRQRVSRMRG
jgi:hypothetical protein